MAGLGVIGVQGHLDGCSQPTRMSWEWRGRHIPPHVIAWAAFPNSSTFHTPGSTWSCRWALETFPVSQRGAAGAPSPWHAAPVASQSQEVQLLCWQQASSMGRDPQGKGSRRIWNGRDLQEKGSTKEGIQKDLEGKGSAREEIPKRRDPQGKGSPREGIHKGPQHAAVSGLTKRFQEPAAEQARTHGHACRGRTDTHLGMPCRHRTRRRLRHPPHPSLLPSRWSRPLLSLHSSFPPSIHPSILLSVPVPVCVCVCVGVRGVGSLSLSAGSWRSGGGGLLFLLSRRNSASLSCISLFFLPRNPAAVAI